MCRIQEAGDLLYGKRGIKNRPEPPEEADKEESQKEAAEKQTGAASFCV